MSTPIQPVPLKTFWPHVRLMLAGRIADNIMRLRAERGWSRPELAKRCNPPTSGQQVERLEKGDRRMTVDWVERIATGLGVDPASLLNGEPQQRDYSLSEQVANEIARTLALVAREGAEPENGTVQALSLILQELSATFAKHPQAYRDPAVALPVLDIAGRRFAPAAN